MVEDDDATSDNGEIGSLRAGFIKVKLSKFTKRRIQAPWSKAFIVKVFGRPISLNYIQMKLMALWKLAGKLDCVDLEKDFYLVHFSLKEDHDAVLSVGKYRPRLIELTSSKPKLLIRLIINKPY